MSLVGTRPPTMDEWEKYHINQILLAIPTATPHQKRDILNICKETGCELKQLPGVYQLVNGEVSLLRVMVEAESEELCRKYVDQVVEIVRKKGHVAE